MRLPKIILAAACTVISLLAAAQSGKVIRPAIGNANNYSKQQQQVWQAVLEKYSRINSGDLNYDLLPDTEKKLIDSLENGYGPMTGGVGCSWYCGGGPYKITSNSYLKEQASINYKPNNLHDFNLYTAWVPDTTNGITGKKINFHFKPLTPRVNEITIYNGYIKSLDLWKANSRVKKFKLYINNVFYAVLNLSDTTASQSFTIDPIQSKDKKKDLILTLEITEVYSGTKYRDVAVSEINFSGLDVH